nr:cardiolipin synthase [uncultured Agathobaculum sp.]
MRRLLGRLLADRRVVVGFFLILQLVAVLYGLRWISSRWNWLPYLLNILSFIMVIWLVRKYDNPTYKIAWIIIILVFPLFGGLFYLLWGNTPFNRARTQHKYEPTAPNFADYMRTPATEELTRRYPRHAARARYIQSLNGMPAWTNTETHYFSVGEEMFASMCEELRRANKFVYFEYFIIEEGVMWNTILDILKEKVRCGVDVRVIYDDVGSVATLPTHYDRYLASLGIRAVRFNRFVPTLNTYLNYRNHRKMMIIDGNVGYMGGINLADEYINKKVRFGHWKDTGIMLRGDGTANMTSLFLQMWEYVTGEPVPRLDPYLPTVKPPADGFVQPFADSPLDDINIGESTYLQIIHNAKDYVYITTPYLVLDNEMITALTIAAQSGVDVRILTPGIPDKKLVYMITRSYYQQLYRAGVKIYEYRPGFLHAKCLVSDDDTAVVGTINMDFRSFFLHFECATCFYHSSVVAAVKRDILETINVSRQIDGMWLHKVPWLRSITASVLRLFAPLL